MLQYCYMFRRNFKTDGIYYNMEGTTLILQVTCLSAGDRFITLLTNKLVANKLTLALLYRIHYYASSVKVGDITA